MDDLQLARFSTCTNRLCRLVAIISFALMMVVGPLAMDVAAQQSPEPPPSNAVDEVVLISTRSLGTSCNSSQLEKSLYCERYGRSDSGTHWKPIPWQEVVADRQTNRPTIVYVHGNRIARGEDRKRGMLIYRSLVRHRQTSQPIRLIIWSWPATQIRGLMKDYHLKAARSRPAGWQLAWFLDRLPEQTPVSIIGYSLGSRVVSGALHFLGGGELNGLRFPATNRNHRAKYRVALVAAAFDADWMQPRSYHGRAMSQIDQLWLLNNRHDPAMRYYHLSVDRGRMPALGWVGVAQPRNLGVAAQRVHAIDVTKAVGRSHALVDYLAVSRSVGRVWRQLTKPKDPALLGSTANLADWQ